ncbi:DUF4383 domain-containing protein [Saccharothrix yanglingensis]|uniref:DUF4383 domain-containing protein n=1 Tax=Saccharothrix yanglingensis TaxID=659496 RepID=A0ABU0X377_9PSEU|nr:DUF4383 domain-containing protein [Saccharothrix yanglingensis]MDQ2586582.1 hypothetical protein [Saccharothrix yanglingensis]
MTTSAERVEADRRPVQVFALLVGAVFLVVGVLGFVPGVTAEYGELGFAGPHSHALLFGVFQVSVLHNLVHLLFGVAGLAASRARGTARLFLVAGGFVYLLLWVYGSIVGEDGGANFVPFNAADNLLHLGLGAGMVLLAVVATFVERSRGQYPDREQRGR